MKITRMSNTNEVNSNESITIGVTIGVTQIMFIQMTVTNKNVTQGRLTWMRITQLRATQMRITR